MKTFKKLVFLFLIATIIPANIFPLKITDEDLVQFDSLLEDLANDNIVELNISNTSINDDQLASILKQISNLSMLWLEGCTNLHYFEVIEKCTQLQKLDLARTSINDKQLASILNQIGENLLGLNLYGCNNLHNNFGAIINCTRLQGLNLSNTSINDDQLADILNQIKNLSMLWLEGCTNLHYCETIKIWAQERKVKLFLS